MGLRFGLLGELEVRRDGRLLALPQSKKTRALLAYLVLTGREHRRDALSSLLWDVTDDPRGALRWSLSKLRPLVDDKARARLVADRDHVSFALHGAEVDVLTVRQALVGGALAKLDVERLESLLAEFRGDFLEGLDLHDFDEYQAWCVAEREAARTLRLALLQELTTRSLHTPLRAATFGRAWVQLDPTSEEARVALIRSLGALGRRDEARQYYESGLRIDKELGRPRSLVLDDAWRAWGANAATRSSDAGESKSAVAMRAPTPEASPRNVSQGFVGRALELTLLDAVHNEAERSRSRRVLLLVGEPGAGKTRLIDEWSLRAGARDVRVLRGAAFEAERGRPYAAWREILPLDLEAFEPASRERLFARALEAVNERESGGALAIVIDDAQWLDEGSTELLHWVMRNRQGRATSLVLAARQGEVADNAALLRLLRALRRDGALREHALGGFSLLEMRELLQPTSRQSDVERIFAQSAGNPLLALELARSSHESFDDVLPTVSGLVRDRVAALPHDPADVLRWAAVTGPVAAESLAALAAVDATTIVSALELLEARSLLVSREGVLGFAHPIVRTVVYAELSEARRRIMHRRVAEHLAASVADGRADIADVAHHAALANDSALAAEACLTAARRSLRLFANADAFALTRRGLRHADQLPEPDRTRRKLELMEVAFAARRPPDAAEVAGEVSALAERALDLGALEHARLGFHLLSYMSWESGGFADAKRHMLQAELASRGANEVERVRGIAEAARCLVLLERDLPHAQALALEAVARGKQSGVEPSATFDALGMIKLHQGKLDEAERELERARGLARALRDRHDEFQALEHLVMLELQRQRYDSAWQRARELVALGEKFREGSEAPFAEALAALARTALGHEDAEDALEQALTALTHVDAKHRLAFVLTRSAILARERGDVARARARAQRALAIAELLARPTEVALALVVLVRVEADARAAAALRARLGELALADVAAPVRPLVEEALLAPEGEP